MTLPQKQIFDFFISHNSATKELARWLYHISLVNSLSVWFDEGLLDIGDELRPEIEDGINSSAGFVLLHCEDAMKSSWVQEEMRIAKSRKTLEPAFKIVVV